MYFTLERLKLIYYEINEIGQFIGAVIGLISILLLFVPKTSIMDDDSSYLLPTCLTSFLHKTFYYLGIPQLMMYIRPQEYYENLLKKLNGIHNSLHFILYIVFFLNNMHQHRK